MGRPSHDFAERVIAVLEFKTRNWRYFDQMCDQLQGKPDSQVLTATGYDWKTLQFLRELFLQELLTD